MNQQFMKMNNDNHEKQKTKYFANRQTKILFFFRFTLMVSK